MDRILLVDDEERVLAGIRRNLRKSFDITTALSGAEALEKLEQEGPFAVIVSDMQMPEMNGVEFLQASRNLAPDSVRIMLTGNADQETATLAINRADVYKFLNKPVESNDLADVLNQAATVYRNGKIERDLLENTFQSSIDVLVEVMALAQPEVFGRAPRLAQFAVDVGAQLSLDEAWILRTAALLCHIGCLHASGPLTTKLAQGAPLTQSEQAEYGAAIAQGADMLQKIPRLEEVVDVIRYQATANQVQPEADSSLIGQVLHAVMTADAALSQGMQRAEVLALLREHDHAFSEAVVGAVDEVLLAMADNAVQTINVSQLAENMVLAEDVVDGNGVLLVCRGWEAKSSVTKHLQRAAENGLINGEIQVYVR